MKAIKKLITLGIVFFLIINSFSFPVNAMDVKKKEKIVLVGDISQSLTEANAEENLENGLKLVADLTPYQAEIAFITVDTEIRTNTDFYDVSVADNRNEIKSLITSSTFTGGTNLVLGLEEAVTKLNGSSGRIIMLADISDHTLTRTSNFEEMTERAIALGNEAKKNDIIIDLILVGTPDETHELTKRYLSLPSKTGGTLKYIENSRQFPVAVEKLFFSNYDYNMYPITGINSTDKEQEIDILLPTSNIARSRIYVSATTPANGIRATYATAELGAEINFSYAMIDLNHPAQEGITLYLDTGKNKTTKVYLITDYDINSVVTAQNELIETDDNESFVQKTWVNLTLIDNRSNSPLLSTNEVATFSPMATLTSPSGIEQQLNFTPNEVNTSYIAEFYPKEYGTYHMTCTMGNGDYTFSVPVTNLEITKEPVPPPTWIKPTLISIVVGLLIISGAIWFYIYEKKKKENNNQSAVELEKTYEFTGKFHFATIVADGGKREVDPFVFYLEKVKDRKRLTLKEIYTASGQSDLFPEMNKIWITPGPGDSVIIKNNSNTTIQKEGKVYGYREKLQLFYNDKVFLIFEKDENEIELYYKQTQPIRSKVTGSKISFAIS